jgi:NAD(P)H-binding
VATVLIIGASRGIGLETVKAALEAGHSVRALARSARRIAVDHPKLKKMAGDALEMATVKRALSGVDVVIQSLGVSAGPEIIFKPTQLFANATRMLITAMEEDVQISRFRFFMGEPRSQWCNDGQFGLLAKGDALGAQCTGASGADSHDPAETAISAKSSSRARHQFVLDATMAST